MNILIISHMFPSACRPNNGTFVQQQALALKSLGHNVTVVSPIPWVPKWLRLKTKRWQEFQLLPKHEIQDGITVYFKRGLVIPAQLDRWRGRLYFIAQFFFWFRLFSLKEFDVIHSHTVLPDGDLGVYLKSRFKLPIIVTIHGADLLTLHKRSKKELNRILQVLEKADGIGVVSSKLSPLLKRLFG